MAVFDTFVLKVKRGETPFFRLLNRGAKAVLTSNFPLPSLCKPLFRLFYELHFAVIRTCRWMAAYFYREPLFRARCESAGKNLSLSQLPEISGHARIFIGDNVCLNGRLGILSGRFLDAPRLVIQDRAVIGHNTLISVNREVVIEEDVLMSDDCRIYDNDGHPRDAELRARKAPLSERDIRPVRICRAAWIGRGCHIMKGVTIGEGAIIGANSVVVSDIPPYCVAMGNPAEVFFRNVGKPRRNAQAAQ